MTWRRWVVACAVAVPVGLAGSWAVHARLKKDAKVVHRTVFREYLLAVSDGRSRMVAYSPTSDVLADPDHRVMRQQLTLLREKFDGLSIYECGPNAPALVDVARSLGYRAVLMTVWDPRSESELATAASIVSEQGSALALAVSIGSEGLMEKRYTLADVESARAELLQRGGSAAAVEMTTTEPWWMVTRPENRELREFGEFTSINIHVVWDTDIVDPGLAASWTNDRANEVRKLVAGPVLIREAGIPGGGSSPRLGEGLVFDRATEAAYWKAWNGLDGRVPSVVFEGIDNPEKHWRDFEGSWGLLSTALEPWPAWGVFPRLATAAAR
jgi:hypothetical protein